MSDVNSHRVPAVFAFEERSVRAIELDGQVWLVGKDVCDCLGLKSHNKSLSRLDDDERKGVTIDHPLGGPQSTLCISEAGVYRLTFVSRVPAAERFKRWLAHEVLPALRRHGRYESDAGRTGMQPGSREFADAVAAVREARLAHGRGAAADLWGRLGLPPVVSARSGTTTDAPGGLVRAFLADEVVTSTLNRRIGATRLYDAFQAWCGPRGHEPLTRTAFGRLLIKAGLRRQTITGRVFYGGIDFRAAPQPRTVPAVQPVEPA